MNRRLEIPARHGGESIADINRDRFILRPHPLPLIPRVQNLKSRDRLPEQERHTPQIRMAGGVQLADLSILLGTAGGVVHIAQVVFTLDVVLVASDELVFVRQFEHDGEEGEEFDDDLGVAFAAEGFDLSYMVCQDWRLGAVVVAVKFGEVVDLVIVFDVCCESAN